MNNEFFQAITWAFLLYIILPTYVAWAFIWVKERIQQRRERERLKELIAEDMRELDRLKGTCDTD